LHEIDNIIRADIKKYDYNHMLQTLHEFCNTDLSAFYFDVRKDSLYCDRTDSTRRRAARTVMEHIFNRLTAWLAPFLCFTAEEAYLMRSGGDNDSIHMQTFPDVEVFWHNEELGRKWEEIRNFRRVVTGAMELARNDKNIGSSLQARPHVYVTKENKRLLESVDFADICVSSDIHISEMETTLEQPSQTIPSDMFGLPDVPHVGVEVKIARGNKCERCWRVLPEVGKQKHPDLCMRCDDAVTHIRKAAA
jgi:isoleucyl-tRNA synthetase